MRPLIGFNTGFAALFCYADGAEYCVSMSATRDCVPNKPFAASAGSFGGSTTPSRKIKVCSPSVAIRYNPISNSSCRIFLCVVAIYSCVITIYKRVVAISCQVAVISCPEMGKTYALLPFTAAMLPFTAATFRLHPATFRLHGMNFRFPCALFQFTGSTFQFTSATFRFPAATFRLQSRKWLLRFQNVESAHFRPIPGNTLLSNGCTCLRHPLLRLSSGG
jgi:hypothetical protein